MDWLDDGWTPAAAYPTLPKSMTNARAAKKRKHREFYVSEEILDRPVRLKPIPGVTICMACDAEHVACAMGPRLTALL